MLDSVCDYVFQCNTVLMQLTMRNKSILENIIPVLIPATVLVYSREIDIIN